MTGLDAFDPVLWQRVLDHAATLPEVEEGTSYRTPALKVRGRLMARLREDDGSLVVRTAFDRRERLLRDQPAVFHLTDHYVEHPWVLVFLDVVTDDDLRACLEEAWRLTAPKRLVAEQGEG